MSEQKTVFYTPGEDPMMIEAGKRARQSFRFFWRELSWEQKRIIPGLSMAGIKATFQDPPEMRAQNPNGLECEHMWLLEVDFDGKHIEGTLINQPDSLLSVKEGDRVRLAPQQLCDWLYVIGEDVYGGFTIDVMRSQMGAAERKAHDEAWGFDFGTPGIVDLVPHEFIGEKKAKGGFLSGLFGSKPAPQDFGKVAQSEHPMSINMRESLEESLTQNPGMLHETDPKGFTFLHQLSLAGAYDCVDVCLRRGANPNQPAHNGMTPIMLANCLGWKRVVQRLQTST